MPFSAFSEFSLDRLHAAANLQWIRYGGNPAINLTSDHISIQLIVSDKCYI